MLETQRRLLEREIDRYYNTGPLVGTMRDIMNDWMDNGMSRMDVRASL